MRILFLAHRVPDRPVKGDKIRAYHEVRALAARHEVHVFAASDGGDDGAPDWRGEVARLFVAPIRPMAARLRAAWAVAAGGALTAAHFAEPALRGALVEARRSTQFEAAVVYSGAMAPLLESSAPRAPTGPRPPAVVDFVDVDSEKFRLYAEHGTVGGARRIACALEWRRLRAVERRAAESSAACVVCTEDEAATLRAFARPRRLEVVANGVDLSAFPFAPPSGRAAAELLFVGALDYAANVDACERLVRAILPRIRREVPAATVTLVGSRPVPALRELARLDGVALHADVPAVQPHLARATLVVLPFTVARGVQNKALEALASGAPLVVSGAIAKGLAGRDGETWLAADGDDALAERAVALLRDAPRRAQLAERGRALAEAKLGWQPELARFVALVEEVAARGAAEAKT
jgi:sugar transferase (PEP-CTERM/EpsH1 system associated)